MDCLFCKIIDGAIPSSKVYEDDKIYAFKDINPQAPVHVLVIPKVHISSMDEVNEANAESVKHIFVMIPQIAKSLGLENGYRVISNCGDDGCQSVKHLHFHILGGKKLNENMA
ncbi:MAG: histidine triad nucleotide-binding protein [Clostridia bacterium]|nr:histidine triad nucleotide-binding protein [Clostridia bacterium]